MQLKVVIEFNIIWQILHSGNILNTLDVIKDALIKSRSYGYIDLDKINSNSGYLDWSQ